MDASTKIENESTVVIEEKAPAKTTTKKTGTTKKTTTKSTAAKKTTSKKATKKASTAKKSTTAKKAPAKKASTTKTTTKKAPAKTTTKKTEVKVELLKTKPLDETKEDLVLKENNTENEEKVVEKKKEPVIKITPKTDLPRTEDLIMKDDFNHVEVLKKKIQAQKKLNEEVSQNPLKVQISEESEKIAFELDQDNKILEEDNRHLNTEIEKLKIENEDLKKKVEDLVDDVNQKDEKIIVLTNSMVGKSSEVELAKELEVLKKENEALRLELQCKDASEKKTEDEEQKEEQKEEKVTAEETKATKIDVNEKGEVALRIKLLNERIAEKSDRINEVEQELNQLSEKDIVEESFTTKIKEIRRIKKESIKQANFELENLAEQVKSSEEKVLNKKKVYEEKVKELVAFDKSLENKPMNYTDKEEAAKVRTKLTIEKDSLFVDIETNEEYYKKLLTRYENRLTQAEERVKVLEKAENELVEFYLNKLKETKTRENEDYNSEKLERERLLKELDFLSQKIEDTIITEDEPLTIDSYDLEKITKDYAKVVGKLNLINQKYEERSKVEKIILKNEQVVKDYYDAFCNRELCMFNIDENTNKISSMNQEIANSESTEKQELVNNKIASLNNLIADDKQKVEYYTKIIEENRKDEKVDFYIKLINSMAELKTAEKEFKVKAEKLLEKIKTLESVE